VGVIVAALVRYAHSIEGMLRIRYLLSSLAHGLIQVSAFRRGLLYECKLITVDSR